MLPLLFLSLLILLLGALNTLIWNRSRVHWMGPLTATAGSLLAAWLGFQSLVNGQSLDFSTSWSVPLGSFHIGVDALSGIFMILIGVGGALAAIYGWGYLEGVSDKRKSVRSWCWFNLLIASMLVVVLARDGFLFLIAWEVMSLSSFFLVMFDHEKEEVVRAGWIYLVAMHLGTAFLLVMFLLLGQDGDLDFSGFAANGTLASLIFIAALIGFGTKAGFVPLHIWGGGGGGGGLPEAHPAAPSHVSALMSGVMIKTGIYGILRVLTFLEEPLMWWGWTLLIIGVVSGVLGVLFALAQHDLKRLLAYHSVENIGIITIGLGVGLLGIVENHPVMATLGFCGALLHVINHGLFKSLLFFGAGAVLHATGTREIDRLGGLIKKMPITAVSFLVGAVAICGLPPLNGFVSEFFIYAGALTSVSMGVKVWGGLIAIAALAFIGGLASACFTKAFGIVFLGEPRSKVSDQAHEASLFMLGSMSIIVLLCFAIGLSAPYMGHLVLPVVSQLLPSSITPQIPIQVPEISGWISLIALILIVFTILTGMLRWILLRHRSVGETGTWDCGYATPSARMQYTASSFAQPILKMLQPILRTPSDLKSPEGLFPTEAHFHTHTDEVFMRGFYRPVVWAFAKLSIYFRNVQHGRTHLYVLYIVLTLLFLLIWNLR